MEQTASAANGLIETAEEFVRNIFETQVPANYIYHNLDHTNRVAERVEELALLAGFDEREVEILKLSALFHDTGFSRGYENHEAHSAQIAREFLMSHGYPEEGIKEVEECIGATQMSEVPVNKKQMLIRDADTSGLGSDDFFEYTEKLRLEVNDVRGEQIDEVGWDYINLQFLQDHTFYTEEARQKYDTRKKANLKEIKRKLGLKKDKKKDQTKLTTIGSSKSAQTMFKTSLRNHIDLSSIADNKANTMLSVTALIISISLPILGTRLVELPFLMIPTFILMIVCVTAITYATLATRPIKMKGVTTMEDINKKRSNLFFFGNFSNMKYQDYEDGIRYVVAHDDLLDSAITRDLFYLGVALGKKYKYLRKCYNIFMYGIILSILAFAAAFAWAASQPTPTPVY